jgi:hypothetical protein
MFFRNVGWFWQVCTALYPWRQNSSTNWKWRGKRLSWHNFRYYPGTLLEGLRTPHGKHKLTSVKVINLGPRSEHWVSRNEGIPFPRSLCSAVRIRLNWNSISIHSWNDIVVLINRNEILSIPSTPSPHLSKPYLVKYIHSQQTGLTHFRLCVAVCECFSSFASLWSRQRFLSCLTLAYQHNASRQEALFSRWLGHFKIPKEYTSACNFPYSPLCQFKVGYLTTLSVKGKV